MARRSALINVMVKAVHKAARGLIRDFGEVEQLQVSRKGPGDFVSIADMKAEKTLSEELARARPDFGFLMEESGAIVGKDPHCRWIIDPLDGTANFLHGVPHFATTVALENRGEIVAGVTYNPVADEMFWAERGAGAYLNDRRLRVSSRGQLSDALVSTGIAHGHGDDYDAFLGEVRAIMPRVASLRRYGAATLDLAYVAAGRFDVYWQRGLGAWDVAAGILLVREAGGFVTDLAGGADMLSDGAVMAGNEALQPRVLEIVRRARGG